jgi:hypothetical protein
MTGNLTAPAFIPNGSTVPTNGFYLPSANNVAISTNGSQRLLVDSSGNIGIGGSVGFGRITHGIHVTGSGTGEGIRLQTSNGSTGILEIAAESGGAVLDTRGSGYIRFNSSTTEWARFDSNGRLGLGTSSPAVLIHGSVSSGAATARLESTANSGEAGLQLYGKNSGGTVRVGQFKYDSTDYFRIGTTGAVAFAFETSDTERMRIDSSGRVGIGTAAPTVQFEVSGTDARIQSTNSVGGTKSILLAGNGIAYFGTTTNAPQAFITNDVERGRWDTSGRFLVGTSSTSANSTLVLQGASGSSNAVIRPCLSNSSPGAGDQIGMIAFGDSSQRDLAYFFCARDGGTWTAGSSQPTRLVFSTCADGSASPTERTRIKANGEFYHGVEQPGTDTYIFVRTTNNVVGIFDRFSNDGTLLEFRQANTAEGTISVSGSTVSYNGAHLSRWSQLPGGAERTEILRGTVLSNIDEMCGWGDEENEQLNRMKVSDVEGDPSVSGVFQCWDDDDDTYTDDFYCAMTGDFIIRIAEGVTVQRGDLLMSAGDGTAKPQGDDIIRSKTIAKVTSTHVTCTYDDNSYCVPCVLMAC